MSNEFDIHIVSEIPQNISYTMFGYVGFTKYIKINSRSPYHVILLLVLNKYTKTQMNESTKMKGIFDGLSRQ